MILVTGANGYLGSFLSKRLEDFGYGVIQGSRENLNVLDSEACRRMFKTNDIEYVIHAAVRGGRRTIADTSADLYENIVMFENLAVHRDKFKMMINFGSGAAFDRAKDIDEAREGDVLNECPRDYYGLSKNLIAKRIHDINDNIVNLRIFNCFGEKELSDRMIKANCIRHLREEEMIVHSNKKMDFFYIEDLYKVVIYYLTRFEEGFPLDLNLCYEEKLDLLGIAEAIKTLTGRPNNDKLIDKDSDFSYTGSSERLSSLGINLYGLESGILRVYKFLQGIKNEKK